MLVYGAGEVLSLQMSYTNLGGANVVACIDEDVGKIGTTKHGIPVRGADCLGDSLAPNIFLSTNAQYHAQIRAKLNGYSLNVLSFA